MTETHATLAPSAAHRWMECPGSVRLCSTIPNVESPYAALGTFAHEIASLCLRSNQDGVHMIGETDMLHVVDEDMAGHIQDYLDAVREVVEASGKEASMLVEQKVAALDDVYGTADAVVIDDTVLHVFDYKHGAGVLVEVENNPQLRIYAVGVLRTFVKECVNVQRIKVHIVQPRHHHGGHVEESITRDDLIQWAQTMGTRASATYVPDAPLKAGEHCRFCDAKPSCPQLRKDSLARTQHLFEDGDLDKPKDPPLPATLTPDQLAEALQAFPMIEQWMHAVRENAYDRAAKGEMLPGFKLVDKKSHRKWLDEDVTRIILEAYDVDPDAPAKTLSPAQAEKKIPKDQRRALMPQLARKSKTGTVLVPESDKRAVAAPADVFDAIPSDVKSESEA